VGSAQPQPPRFGIEEAPSEHPHTVEHVGHPARRCTLPVRSGATPIEEHAEAWAAPFLEQPLDWKHD
jgi:hypothetical protein